MFRDSAETNQSPAPGEGALLFKHLRVVELASVLAGPGVGQFFAELGAEVIKIENLHTGGDVTRSWKISGEKAGDRSAYFCSCNWGKKSVALDLHTDRGKDIVRRLVSAADIVIASYKPGDAEKLGVGYEQLKSVNERIIYGQITGYGPDNDRVGYDAVVQAEAGFMDLNGERNGPPLKMPVALVDILAGHQLKEGLLLALLEREQTGKGSHVEVGLLQTAIASLANQATNWLITGNLPARKGSSHPNIAPYGDVFETRDGKKILLAVGNDKQFQNLCRLLNLNSLGSSPEFATNEARVAHREQLCKILNTSIQALDAPPLLQQLHAMNIPGGSIQTVREVFEMPEAQTMLLQWGHLMGVKSYVGSGRDIPSGLLPPPGFGEHTLEVLAALGF